MDPAWGVRWTRPEGGLFLWVMLPEGLSSRDLLMKTLDRDIAFVVGTSFHCDRSGQNTMRLNFSFPTLEQLDTAIERMALSIGEMIAERKPAEVKPAEISPEFEGFALCDGAHSLDHLAWNLAVTEVVE
jgi:hypothetical protein